MKVNRERSRVSIRVSGSASRATPFFSSKSRKRTSFNCGFPLARICACFCLQSGGLLSYRVGHLRNHELPLLREQWGSFEAGDIFLGDKGFCSYYDIWQLRQRGIDSVITLARRKPLDAASAVAVLGKDD